MGQIPGIDTGLGKLLENAPGAELDYGFVMDCLKDYSNPRVNSLISLKLKHL